MTKLRLHGTLEELQSIIEILSEQFNLLSVSDPYKDRGQSQYYRLYIDCEMKKNK